MYFSADLSKADAKKLFRDLSKQLHPDKGGNHDDFVKMQHEYENFLKGNFAYTSKQATDEINSINDFIKANEFIKQFDGLKLELTGLWIWLSGDTFKYKDQIKEHGFRWSKSKKKWYKAPYKINGRKRGVSFSKIKNKYGYTSAIIQGATAIK
jgi:curved DNA-binding protein CbpA